LCGPIVSVAVAADAYDRFMGRYSAPLAPLFADFAGVESAGRVIDVGCGPGALTAELVERLGADSVAAVDPSEPFVAAVRGRYPGVAVRQAAAEELPFDDREFEAALAQLVVHFMKDPVGGLREMARVTAPGGVVAASVWDHGGGSGPLSPYWEAVHELDASVDDESQLAGATEGHLTELFRQAGLDGIDEDGLWVSVEHATFDDWWEPYTLGVGPAGAYVVGLDPEEQARLRELCRRRLPEAPFVVKARAWAARAVV
jgi:SAM-dependent methyltransferase